MRPDWLEPLVDEWGPPTNENNSMVPERFRNPETKRVETRCVRFWRWDRDGANYGIVFLGTSPMLKNATTMLAMSGPAGRVEYTCRGDGVAYGVILTLLELAGMPPYPPEPPYLTTQQKLTNVSTSQLPSDEGDRVSDTENTAPEAVENEAPAVTEDTAAEAATEDDSADDEQ